MKETTNTRAIVLRRLKYRENDSRITVYSLEKGLMDLVVRGTTRPKSKLAGHIEPLSLVNVMIVPGRRIDYAGSVVTEKCFLGIKSDLEKIEIASQAVRIFNKLVKEGEADENLFFLLVDFLTVIDSGIVIDENLDLFKYVFIYKFLHNLGHGAEMEICVECKKKLKEERNIFDFTRGGMLCCHEKKGLNSLTVSPDCVKLLRLLRDNNFLYLAKIKANNTLGKETVNSIRLFYNYIVD